MFDSINSATPYDITLDPILKYCLGKGIDIGASDNSIRTVIDGSVDTLDIKPNDKEEITFLCPCDVIPVGDNTYDFLSARHVVEHLNNPIKAIKEWERVLKPGGKIVVTMPDCRLYITDRKLFEISEVRWWRMAEIEMLIEDFKNGIPNAPQDWGEYKNYHSAYYYKHKYLWRLSNAKNLFEYLGFTIIESKESKEKFVETFEKTLLKKYINRQFSLDLEKEFYLNILRLQNKFSFDTLGYAFFLVAEK